MTDTRTLRALYHVKPIDDVDPGRTALVLVDFQEEFFGGRLHLPDAPAAAASARRLLDWARRHGVTVVHVHHIVLRPDSPVFAEGSPGARPVEALASRDGEIVLVKHLAGAFSRTDLDAVLRARGVHSLVIAGLMTHLAVDTTVRDAAVLGYNVVVAADATATRDLPGALGQPVLDRQAVQRVALASLADRFADVLTTDAIVALPRRGGGVTPSGAP